MTLETGVAGPERGAWWRLMTAPNMGHDSGNMLEIESVTLWSHHKLSFSEQNDWFALLLAAPGPAVLHGNKAGGRRLVFLIKHWDRRRDLCGAVLWTRLPPRLCQNPWTGKEIERRLPWASGGRSRIQNKAWYLADISLRCEDCLDLNHLPQEPLICWNSNSESVLLSPGRTLVPCKVAICSHSRATTARLTFLTCGACSWSQHLLFDRGFKVFELAEGWSRKVRRVTVALIYKTQHF